MPRDGGGIGRRTGFRFRRREACGFKSRPSHPLFCRGLHCSGFPSVERRVAGDDCRQLRDGFAQWEQLPEAELFGLAGRSAVALDHHRRLVAGSVGDPLLGLPVGEREGDEGRAEVVRSEAHPLLGRLEEDRAIDPRGLEVAAELAREVAHVRGDDAVAEDVGALGPHLPPGAQGGRDAGGERPGAGVVGLVLLEAEHPAAQVDVDPLDERGLRGTRPLAVEEALEHAALEGDGGAREERGVLLGVEVEAEARLERFREPAERDRRVRDQLRRVDGEAADPNDQLRDVPARPLGHRAAHDLLGVVEGERLDREVDDVGQHVRREPGPVAVLVVVDRAHVIGVGAVQVAREPLLGERLEGLARGDRDGVALLEPIEHPLEHAQRGGEAIARGGGELLEHRIDQVRAARLPEPMDGRREDRPALGRLGLGRAGRHRLRLALLRRDRERDVPGPPALVDAAGRLAGHQARPPLRVFSPSLRRTWSSSSPAPGMTGTTVGFACDPPESSHASTSARRAKTRLPWR